MRAARLLQSAAYVRSAKQSVHEFNVELVFETSQLEGLWMSWQLLCFSRSEELQSTSTSGASCRLLLRHLELYELENARAVCRSQTLADPRASLCRARPFQVFAPVAVRDCFPEDQLPPAALACANAALPFRLVLAIMSERA